MTTETLIELFEKYADDEFLKWDRVENKRSSRSDLHAFLLLDELMPGQKPDIVSSASHDQIWLDPTLEDLAPVITEAQILELIRSGVMLDSETDSLSMFV